VNWEDGVQEIEPTDRARQLPDGRLMHESRLTLAPEWLEQLFQGYRCAGCLERLPEAYPEHCPNAWCHFPVREEQRHRLEIDFVQQHPPTLSGFPLDRERAYLERRHYVKKGYVNGKS
jgi:hypothetical protein